MHEPQVQNFVGKKSNVQSSLANLAAALEERKSPCFGFDKEMKGTAQTHGYITFNRFLSEAASLLGKEAMVNLNVWESSGCRVCSPFFEAADLLGPKPESEQVAPAMSSPASAGAAGSLPSAMCENTVRTVRSSRHLVSWQVGLLLLPAHPFDSGFTRTELCCSGSRAGTKRNSTRHHKTHNK